MMTASWWTFWRAFRTRFDTTGALLPSSRFLARAIVGPSRSAPRPARILEAGPGTGAFTDPLIASLQPGDSLVLVEINERFVEFLEQRLATDPLWKSKRDAVRIHHGPAQDLPHDSRYHAVVCGIPFNNFEPAVVEGVLGGLLGRIEPGGSLSFFEYLGIRKAKSPWVGAAERRRLSGVAQAIRAVLDQHRVGSDVVWLNVPPAVVHHLRVPRPDGAGRP